MRARLIVLLLVVILGLAFAIWKIRDQTFPPPAMPASRPQPAYIASAHVDRSPTSVYAHNLRLHQGPNFVVYVRWLRGQMARAHPNVNPSFDDAESFYLNVTNGVLRANLGDISNYLNSVNSNSPLKNITMRGNGSDITITGTLHKLIPLPIKLEGTLSTASNNRMHMHVNKINVLKVPFKALLGDMNVHLSDFFRSQQIPGIEVTGNDIYFDTQTLLPPPHIRGSLTSVTIDNPDLQAVYGDAREDLQRTEQWRNFLRLSGGVVDFGKLTMNQVDLIMIDISQDAWFDLDLSRYQQQLVNGYTRMTPQAGLQIFMPDLASIPANKTNQDISIQWMKDRNILPPASVQKK
jgi:hypothetical protein